jgi:hypothetical protein
MDKIIEQQAAHYGLTRDQFTDLISDAADYQDYIDYFGEDDE